jgi:hypothetical protein
MTSARRSRPLFPDNPRPPDLLLWAVAIRRNREQSLAVSASHLNADPLAHRYVRSLAGC